MSNNFFKDKKPEETKVVTTENSNSVTSVAEQPSGLMNPKGEGVAKTTTFKIPPVVDPDVDVSDEWKEVLSDNQIKVAKLVLCRGIEIRSEEYSVLSECETKTQFIGFLSFEFNKKEYEHLNTEFSKVDILNLAKDPTQIGADDIEEMLGYKSVEEIKSETTAVSSKIKKDIERQEIEKYITTRNKRNKDGSLDRMLNISEIDMIERNVKKIFEGQAASHVGMQNNDRLGGVVMALNDMSLDARRIYEITKMYYCNRWGLTPESVDNFLMSMINDRTDWLYNNGIDNRKDIGRGHEFAESMKNNILTYCKKIPDWEPGQVVYESEFLQKLDSTENEIMRKAYQKSRSDENKAMIRSMSELWDPEKLKPRKRGMVKDADSKAIGFLDRRKRKQSTIENPVELPKSEEVVKVEEVKRIERSGDRDVEQNKTVPASVRYAKTVERISGVGGKLHEDSVRVHTREDIKEGSSNADIEQGDRDEGSNSKRNDESSRADVRIDGNERLATYADAGSTIGSEGLPNNNSTRGTSSERVDERRDRETTGISNEMEQTVKSVTLPLREEKVSTLKLRDDLTLDQNMRYLELIKKYTDMGLSQDEAVLLADNEINKMKNDLTVEAHVERLEEAQTVAESIVTEEVIPEPLPEPTKQPITHSNENIGKMVDDFLERRNKTNLNDYTQKYEKAPDPKILANTSDRATKIKLYRESKKNGRVYYLVNSNYEVMVNKIYDRNQISYILQLLQNGAIRDINLVDSFVKKELLQIVYKTIEFNFDVTPSYNDFVQCLSEADLTGLMMMIAIVNIPEDKEGRIPLTIQSVQCTNPECESMGMLKNPIKIDLKEEFTRIYDIDSFSIKYNTYKSKTYKTIQDAYYDANESIIQTFSDEVFTYEIGLSAPTIWKSQVIRDNMDATSYKRLADSMEEKRDFITRDYDVNEVIDYMNSHSYQDFRYRAVAIQDIIEDRGETALSELEKDELKLLGLIGLELSKVKSNDAVFNIVADVIDFITIKDVSTGEVVSEYITLEDLYDIIDIISQGPTEMMEAIVQAKQKFIDSTVATDLEFDAEELAGQFDFETQYKAEADFIHDVRERNSHLEPEKLEEYVKKQVQFRNEAKEAYDKRGVCVCGNTKWKLNYTNILFFWAYNH